MSLRCQSVAGAAESAAAARRRRQQKRVRCPLRCPRAPQATSLACISVGKAVARRIAEAWRRAQANGHTAALVHATPTRTPSFAGRSAPQTCKAAPLPGTRLLLAVGSPAAACAEGLHCPSCCRLRWKRCLNGSGFGSAGGGGVDTGLLLTSPCRPVPATVPGGISAAACHSGPSSSSAPLRCPLQS